jgi:AraC family transcriptional regulator
VCDLHKEWTWGAASRGSDRTWPSARAKAPDVAPSYFGKLVRQRAAGAFVVTESAFRAGSALPTHSHDAPYFTFTLRGSYRERYGNHLRECMPGTAVAHPAFEAHSQDFVGDPALLIRIGVVDGEPDCELQAGFERPLAQTSARIANAIQQMHLELASDDVSTEMIVEGLAHELTALALSRDCSSGGSRKRALCARALIRSSLRHAISLAVLSEEIGVSRTTIYRDFKSTFGCPPGDHLRQARLAAAASRLRKTDSAICEVAAECGFYDQSHFDRSFRLAFGVSPLEYRRRSK